MKQLFFLFLMVSSVVPAQNFEDTWTGHFSYTAIKDITEGNDKVYAASENAIFEYDLSTNETATISTVNGLSGEEISSLYYSENFGLLIVGYETGLMEIVIDGDENVLTIVDILDKQTIPPDKKRINHFNEYNGELYIATEFGVSVYDLAALEFGDTYFIGDAGAQINITQTAVKDPFIYASTSENGIRRAMVEDDDLIDFANWDLITSGEFGGVQRLLDEVYTVDSNNVVYTIDAAGSLAQEGTINGAVKDFGVHDNLLVITTATNIFAFSSTYNLEATASNSTPNFDFTIGPGLALNDNFYIGTTAIGMLEIPFGTTDAVQILPDGPLLNLSVGLDATPGQVWVVFGEISGTFNPFPLNSRGISNLKEGVWTNLPFESIFSANDLVDVSINPENPEEAYFSSFHKGLLKVVSQEPEMLFDNTNSGLSPSIDPVSGNEIGVRIYDSDYDREGNLWMTQSLTDDGLIKMTPGGQFQPVDLTPIIEAANELALTSVASSREGYVFFGAVDTGVIGYNPNNGSFNKMEEDTGQGNLPSTVVQALAFDNQNRLWIGTRRGLRVLFNVGGFFDTNSNTDAQAIIILEDGVPQELLFELSITDIEVDGSNNKWIATASSGVFYLSSNGQETLLRFTKDNSPLPSNTVQDIAIDSFTGVVYFATPKGLVAYNGSATAPRDNLENVYAYPNPVRPGFTGNVTIDGLTASANVKITDIEGNLVFEETSEGGSVLWDTTAFGKYNVASGVYLVLITTEDALETKVSKIMVVR